MNQSIFEKERKYLFSLHYAKLLNSIGIITTNELEKIKKTLMEKYTPPLSSFFEKVGLDIFLKKSVHSQ